MDDKDLNVGYGPECEQALCKAKEFIFILVGSGMALKVMKQVHEIIKNIRILIWWPNPKLTEMRNEK